MNHLLATVEAGRLVSRLLQSSRLEVRVACTWRREKQIWDSFLVVEPKGLADGLHVAIRGHAKGHSADKWQIWDLNSGVTPRPIHVHTFQHPLIESKPPRVRISCHLV